MKQLCIAKCEIFLTQKRKKKHSPKNILQIYGGASYLLRFVLRHAAYQFEEQRRFYFLIFNAKVAVMITLFFITLNTESIAVKDK